MIRQLLASTILFALASQSTAQVRMIRVDEFAQQVTIRNFSSSTTVDVSGYFMCRQPGTYQQLSTLSIVGVGDLSLSPSEELSFTYNSILSAGTGIGLYVRSGFSNPANMADYMQYKGVSGFRESVAAGAGIWTQGSFASGDPGPYFYVGNGASDNGSSFWSNVPLPSASGSVVNGSGANPLCLSSEPALLGQSWNSSIDSTVRANPTLAVLVVQALPSAGFFLPGGELLVDLNSGKLLRLSAPANGSQTNFSLPVPYDPAVAGLSATVQGVVFGGGYTLCNAFTFTAGL